LYYHLKQDFYIYPNKKPPYKKVCIGMRGQYGDFIMQEPALREFIRNNPDTEIVLCVSKKFEEVMPLFYNYHKNIVEFKVFEGYENWPTVSDEKYIKSQNFDAMFPNGKSIHPQPDWAKYRHITIETALIMGLSARTAKINLKMPENIKKESKTACIHMFSSKYPGGVRSISIEKQTMIADYLIQKGYKVYQLSAPHQPKIKGTIYNEGSYYDACIRMLSTDLLISCDSGMLFVSSGYDHPTLGLFSTLYNPLVKTTKNWQPINPNAIYIESPIANNININAIKEQIDNLIRKIK